MTAEIPYTDEKYTLEPELQYFEEESIETVYPTEKAEEILEGEKQ